jgi:SAM-dependent methyltransferase
MASRKSKLFQYIDFQNHRGLEIGPLFSPLLRKKDADVSYMDHCSTEDLKNKYSKDPNVDTSKIMDIDYVWNPETIAQLARAEQKFDFIIASHVVEHVPNLIAWFETLYSFLNEDGIISLAAPDRRYTFDHYRQETKTSELVASYIEGRTKPSALQIYDHFANTIPVEIKDAWQNTLPKERETGDGDHFIKAYRAALKSRDNLDHYIDAHCSVFTDESFIRIIKELVYLDLFHFKIIAFYRAEPFEHEFQVIFRKVDKANPNYKQEIFDSLPDFEKSAPIKPSISAYLKDFARSIKRRIS